MLNTEESYDPLSLDALLGAPSPDDEPFEEPPVQTPSSSDDLLQALGLAAPPALAAEEVSEVPDTARALDLAALLEMGEPRLDGQRDGERSNEPEIDGVPFASASVAEEVPGKPESSVRSRFADAPAFRTPEKTEVQAEAEAPSEPAEPAPSEESAVPVKPKSSLESAELSGSEDPSEPVGTETVSSVQADPLIVTPAVRYLAGKERPRALPMKCAERPADHVPFSTAPASAVERGASCQAVPAPKPSLECEPVLQRSACVVAPAKQKPAVAVAPGSPSEEPPVRPAWQESAGAPSKHSRGAWYLISVCLFALALACTCYAVFSSVESHKVVSSASLSSESGDRRFRYEVEGSDGALRSVVETARFDVDGFLSESTVSFEAASDEEAAWFLEDARAQFGNEWMSGAVENGNAVFTVRVADSTLDRAAYAALLQSGTKNFESLS